MREAAGNGSATEGVAKLGRGGEVDGAGLGELRELVAVEAENRLERIKLDGTGEIDLHRGLDGIGRRGAGTATATTATTATTAAAPTATAATTALRGDRCGEDQDQGETAKELD